MFCSIVKTLDYDVLNGNIAIYQEANGEEPYLFMNEATANAICEDVKRNVYVSKIFGQAAEGNYIGRFNGLKIYTNNDLQFGEVELR